MISVQEALDIILTYPLSLSIEQVDLDKAIGRLLREDLYADRDFPPYDRVTMDGIAIRYSSFAAGNHSFAIEGIAAAGMAQKQLEGADACLEVMTGAMMPLQADTVIRYEDLVIENGVARITVSSLREGQNIHWRGSDRKQGSPVVGQGKALSPAEIGVAATVGKAQLAVSRLPKVMIISTGDELVEVHQQPLAHQIRRSNVHRLRSTLAKHFIEADTAHLNDDKAEINREIDRLLKEYDVLILSGGVSKGKYDYIPAVMEELGVEKLFHRIAQRPGKPFWFGRSKEEKLIFALPGNPVSSFMCMQAYFLPWLRASLGVPAIDYPSAVLQHPVTFKPDLTYYLQVAVTYDNQGRILAHPVEGHGSGDLANLADADAFLQLPRGKELFEEGEVFPLIRYR